jgi:hypothetical protein
MSMRSTMPRKSSACPIGIWMAAMLPASESSMSLMVRKKSAFSRSILLITKMVLSSRSNDEVHTRSVPTATPGDRRHHDQHAVGGGLGAADLADEVGVAGGVDDVERLALPLVGVHGRVDADLAPLLLGRDVGDGGAVLDAARLGEGAGAVEHRLHERRLPCAAVREDGDVADLGHQARLPCGVSVPRAAGRDGAPR